MFGAFDLAVISFTDDFQLASQKFHPFNENLLNNLKEGGISYRYTPNDYTYQISSCAIPDLGGLNEEIKNFRYWFKMYAV